jgi:hypothetical protein
VEALYLVLAEEVVEVLAVSGGSNPGGDGDGGFELDDWFCLVLLEACCLR